LQRRPDGSGRLYFFAVIKTIDDPLLFKTKALQWAASFDVCCYFDSNNFADPYSKFDCLIAVGAKDQLVANAGNAFTELEHFRSNNPGWMTGFFGYDLKNETELLSSNNSDSLSFPDLYFFTPEYLILIKGNAVDIIADDPETVLTAIESWSPQQQREQSSVAINSRFSKAEYLDTVTKIKDHIARGDIYVTNFCQEFYAENTEIDPLELFTKFNKISPAPFSAFLKWNDHYVICASPERFLAKRGNKLISQPIKGTAKRGKNSAEDEAIKQELRSQTKEQQENVMIVDLVRNDLTRSAKPGTVTTEELFGIYTFKQVHQMISTVVSELDQNVSPVTAIKNAFPMGSMTGAPKISAMQLMEQFERSKRGLYSGAIGYFSPDGDFDFNVVIRTLLYNQKSKYLSFQAGSAITFHADAEKEYEECLLKVKAIREVLGQS
jgi:para-aminobenzoate synthetase component 1